jgi:hypothetical protein
VCRHALSQCYASVTNGVGLDVLQWAGYEKGLWCMLRHVFGLVFCFCCCNVLGKVFYRKHWVCL